MRLSKDQWISEGLKLLQTDGPAGLRIESLCKRLGVTKGSFYHHFVNLEDFKRRILEQWERDNTSEVIRQSRRANGAVQQLLDLRRLSSAIAGGPEVAIRAWARHDALARRHQQRVDRIRYLTLQSLYRSRLPEGNAKLLARLVCCLFVGAQHLTPPVSTVELNNMYDFLAGTMKEPFDESSQST